MSAPKHLGKYFDEFVFRYNNRKISDNEGFTTSLLKAENRLTYKALIAKYGFKENKALSDKDLIAKYEAGLTDLSKVIKESMKDYKPVKRIVTERAGKKDK